MPNIILRQDLGNTEPRSANVVVKNSGLSNIELDNNFNNVNNGVEYNSGNIDILFNQVSSAYEQANSAFASANNVAPQIEPAFNQANTGVLQAQSSFGRANSAYNQANIGVVQAQAAFNQANTAYNTANTKFNSSGGIVTGSVDIEGSLIVEGNFTVSGNVTTVSANNLVLKDNMIYLNENGNTANPDLGISGAYNDGTYRHAGFFRDSSDGYWKVYDQYLPEPDISPYIDTSNSSFRIANFQANTIIGTLFSGSGASLTSIPNSSLVNSSVTVNGAVISLGSSGTVTANAEAETLTGTTLASGVTGSSLTSVGTITSGTWSGSFGAVSGANLTSLTAGNLSGTIPSAVLGNSTHYVGTTAISLNRGSGSQTLTGVSIDGNAATATALQTARTIGGVSFNGTANINLPGVNTAGNQNTSGTAYNITQYTINQSVGTGNNVQHNSIGVNTAASGTAGEIRATNNITAYYSDLRLKTILGNVDNALEKISRMQAIYFENNQTANSFGYTNSDKQIGLIAQEVQNEVPEAVKLAPFDSDFDENGVEYSISGENYLTVQYEKLIPILLQAIKDLSKKVNYLEEQINHN